MFDFWDRRYRNFAKRGLGLRVVHVCLFELGMLIAGVFIIMWWLSMSFMDALFLDIGFAVFFLVYAFAYNWIYDLVFPRRIPA
ncbi:MAG: chlorhexidine efflux transporter [Sneathiella sp.]